MAQQIESELGWHMTGNAAEIADILVEFAEEIRRGEVVVWKEQNELHIDATGRINMTVRAAQNTNEGGLHIDLKWET